MASDAKSPADLVRGHTSVLPPRWIRNVPRLEDVVIESFRSFLVPDISDAVGPLYTMSPGMRPLYEPIGRLAGRALTVKAPPGDSLTVHGAITLCQPGDVLVIDSRGHVESCSGGSGMLIAPIRAGLAGVVVDGAWRDIPDLQALNFPIFGRGTCPVSRPKGQLGEINVPICCGGVVVNAGDLIVADAEGIVVVPRTGATSVREHVRQRSLKARAPQGQDARAPEAGAGDQVGALADHLEQRAKSHYGGRQANASQSSIFAGVFAAAGGVAMDWDETRRASGRDG
jgi:4-hydroxy-4-methyl-2-oxoglutarate aldolase